MRNEFFADRRDYFKYDLLLDILEGLPHLLQLTYVPMLTPNRGIHGQLTDYQQGNRRGDLYQFLQHCLTRPVERDIRKLRGYFHGRFNGTHYAFAPYRDDVHFTHDSRKEYFEGIHWSSLRDAVIFFDPDNGLERKNFRRGIGDLYLRYAELEQVFRRVDESSVIVVY